ncbi:MAG: histidinol-phosphate transaminase [Verrucomicrobia bacterium]|jgi:histidinol-phosphate aminotransferase|nr:histidinol-phosphate transaminase [Verrucomicrobiota bacterium]
MPLPFRLNPALAELPVYEPGRPIEEVARELGLDPAGIIKLASNENPLGPSPRALAAMSQALRQCHLYPDGSAFQLKRRLADKLGLEPGHLILGNGSNEIIEFLGHALMDADAEVVVSQYCFAVYPLVTHLFGARLVTVPARAFGHDLDAMRAAVTPRTRAVFVANPNNPTGTRADADALERLVNRVPEHVVLVLDEAYIEFLDDPTDFLPLVRGGSKPNLILMRTFSKIHGLAGLRLGYGIGHPEFIAALEKIRQPFNTNAVAQAGALAALDDDEHVARTRRNNTEGLRFLEAELGKLGLQIIPSHANFLLAKVGDGTGVFRSLQQRGVIVRPMGGYQLPEWIRISVGTPAENARCLEALAQVLER